MSNRFPRSVYARGSEPDPRFSLANERTFLAWVRTSLALLAAGVALEALQVPISPGFRLASAIVFVLAAAYVVLARKGREAPEDLTSPHGRTGPRDEVRRTTDASVP